MTTTPSAVHIPVMLATLLAVMGCGARSDLGPSSNDAGVSSPTPVPTSPPPSDCSDAGAPPPAVSCEALEVHLTVAAACSIARPACTPVDAEGFVSVPTCPGCGIDQCDNSALAPERVLVMNRLGKGHVIGWCDSTKLIWFMEQLEAVRYLGQSATPRVASLGKYPCDHIDGIPGATYLGPALPAGYGDGASLAADWDVLVACGADADFGAGFVAAVQSFVHDHGRGLLAVSDYVCDGAEVEPAFEQMNALTSQAGFVFEAVNLGYGSGDLVAECVADYPP